MGSGEEYSGVLWVLGVVSFGVLMAERFAERQHRAFRQYLRRRAFKAFLDYVRARKPID